MHRYNRFLTMRPLSNDDDVSYSNRTHISHPESTYNVYDPRNMTAQVILYHWCRTEFVNGVAIADLHSYLFGRYPEITKRQMGRTIVQSVTYDPRKMKGITKENHKAQMCYIWRFQEDFMWGLEWMMSMWIWRLEHDWKDIQDNTDQEHMKMTADIFDDLAAQSVADAHSLYVEPLTDSHVFEPNESIDWMALWAKYELITENWRPVPKSGRAAGLVSTLDADSR